MRIDQDYINDIIDQEQWYKERNFNDMLLSHMDDIPYYQEIIFDQEFSISRKVKIKDYLVIILV